MSFDFDPARRLRYVSQFLILLGIFILSNFLIFPVFAVAIGSALYGLDFMEADSVISNPQDYDYGISLFLIVQSIASIGGFFVTAFVFLKSYRYAPFDYLKLNRKTNYSALAICLFLILSNIAIVNLLGALNYKIPAPGFGLSGEMDEERRKITESLLLMNNFGDFLVRLLVMALIPAFVEEVFFRGLLQRFVSEWFGKASVGIVVSALVFSLLHFKFSQIIPIFYVGLLFGYIFYKTGNLKFTILMHFIHNGFVIGLSYFIKDSADKEYMQDGYFPEMSWLLPSILVFGICFYLLHKYFFKTEDDFSEITEEQEDYE